MKCSKTDKIALVFALFIIFYNEYLIFYLAARNCTWNCDDGCDKDLKAIMISDTHLLGKRKGHWLDKLKREWQMRQSFEAATWTHNPDVVFFLGDLLDEGQWAGREEYKMYANRFREMFSRKNIISLAGNHDLGFHYAISPGAIDSFKKEFNHSSVDEIDVKGHRFILINSMALHGDECRLCHDAEEKLKKISENKKPPIILQHFPMFRKSDVECEKMDDYHIIDKEEIYREQWDVLSRDSTNKLIEWLKPRAVFGGHTHKMCKKRWKSEDNTSFYEYTVNSFSWRNGDIPAILMVTITDNNINVNTCRLPSETTQINVYIISVVIIILYIVIRILKNFVRFSHFPTKYNVLPISKSQ